MIENAKTFGERFETLRGPRSYQELSDAIFLKVGQRISPQAMHKWVKQSNGITIDNARLVAEFFEVSPAWLLFGEGEAKPPPINRIVENLPADNQQQTLDFIEYQISKSEGMIASEKLTDYMAMIQRIREDMEQRRKGEK